MTLKQGLEDRVRGLALENVDMIFVKERHLFERLSAINVPGVTKKITLMLVTDLNDLKALSHVDMRALGWVREEKITVKDAVKVLDSKGYDVQMPEEKL